jgi:glycine/D-amino acid oxidase-like deaminating enzyme
MSKKVLIIGGGLAGTFIALESARAGHRVRMVDYADPKAATRVAAGLYNVVTGRVANKTWRADELLATFYSLTDDPDFSWLRRYIHRTPIYRPYPDPFTANEWQKKLQQPEFSHLGRHHATPLTPEIINNPLGGLEIQPCGWVETIPLCEGILTTIATKYDFRREQAIFDYKSLNPATGSCRQSGLEGTYDEVIFAEGTAIRHNPWFPFVEIRPLKGQLLELRIPPDPQAKTTDQEPKTLPQDHILLRKAFLIPKGNSFYTAGSTYEPNFEDAEVTAEGIKTIRDSVEEAITLPFEVVDARAAIRPTTFDRRPVLGRHPDFPRLVVFNGLGTKGVLQAPFCAKVLRDWLDGRMASLPKDIALERFLKKFA